MAAAAVGVAATWAVQILAEQTAIDVG